MNSEQSSTSRMSSDGSGKERLDEFVFLVPSSSVYMAAKRKRFGEQNRDAASVKMEGSSKSALIIDSIAKQVCLIFCSIFRAIFNFIPSFGFLSQISGCKQSFFR